MNSYKVWKPNASFKNLNENINYPIICWVPKCLRKKVVPPNPNPDPNPPQPIIVCPKEVDTNQISIKTFYVTTLPPKYAENYANAFQLINKPIQNSSGYKSMTTNTSYTTPPPPYIYNAVNLTKGTYNFRYISYINMELVNNDGSPFDPNQRVYRYYRINCFLYINNTPKTMLPLESAYIVKQVTKTQFYYEFTTTLNADSMIYIQSYAHFGTQKLDEKLKVSQEGCLLIIKTS
jgi:hypothetical protein